MRLETRVGRSTRIEVVTDGVLLRMLQTDPSLSGVGAVLFDEFHERNVDADLALALCLDAQALGRPDLRCVRPFAPRPVLQPPALQPPCSRPLPPASARVRRSRRQAGRPP